MLTKRCLRRFCPDRRVHFALSGVRELVADSVPHQHYVSTVRSFMAIMLACCDKCVEAQVLRQTRVRTALASVLFVSLGPSRIWQPIPAERI